MSAKKPRAIHHFAANCFQYKLIHLFHFRYGVPHEFRLNNCARGEQYNAIWLH